MAFRRGPRPAEAMAASRSESVEASREAVHRCARLGCPTAGVDGHRDAVHRSVVEEQFECVMGCLMERGSVETPKGSHAKSRRPVDLDAVRLVWATLHLYLEYQCHIESSLLILVDPTNQLVCPTRRPFD